MWPWPRAPLKDNGTASWYSGSDYSRCRVLVADDIRRGVCIRGDETEIQVLGVPMLCISNAYNKSNSIDLGLIAYQPATLGNLPVLTLS